MRRRFEDNPDNALEKQEKYKSKLAAMHDRELYCETRNKIWLSIYSLNNGASCYHWQSNATYSEWDKRGKVERYSDAYKAEMLLDSKLRIERGTPCIYCCPFLPQVSS